MILEVLESAYWFLSYGKVVFHCQLTCTVTYIMSGLGSKKYPKMTLQVLESAYWFLGYGKVVFRCQLMCTETS